MDLYNTIRRMGATLYWEKYWSESNGWGLCFKYDTSDLEDMDIDTLKTIKKEMEYFISQVTILMKNFYSTCKYRLEEVRNQKAEEEKAEKEYQAIKDSVIKGGHIKRLVTEIL